MICVACIYLCMNNDRKSVLYFNYIENMSNIAQRALSDI